MKRREIKFVAGSARQASDRIEASPKLRESAPGRKKRGPVKAGAPRPAGDAPAGKRN